LAKHQRLRTAALARRCGSATLDAGHVGGGRGDDGAAGVMARPSAGEAQNAAWAPRRIFGVMTSALALRNERVKGIKYQTLPPTDVTSAVGNIPCRPGVI
jgi:hypothetical protein